MKITKLIAVLERVKAKHGEDVDVFVPEIIGGVQSKPGSMYGVTSTQVLTATFENGGTPKKNTILLLNKSSRPPLWKTAAAGK